MPVQKSKKKLMVLGRKRFLFAKIDPSLLIAIFIFAAILIHAGCGGGSGSGSSTTTTTASTSTTTSSTTSTTSTTTTTQTTSTTTTIVGDSDDYNIGNPTLTDIWVDPSNGNDNNTGSSRSQALRTVSAAWAKIPSGAALTGTGYRIQLTPGTYPAYDQANPNVPGQLTDRTGTYSFPIIIQSSDGLGQVLLPGLEVNQCQYIYFINLNTRGPSSGGDGFHISSCKYVLIRSCDINGNSQTQEVLKGNQCQYVYVEDCNIYGPTDNVGLDFVAVQYGHIFRNNIHNTGDWCMYLKGGSAYFRIEGNELYNAGNGGFTAGQGSGFEYMVNPWLHYEAYDIKFVNNVVHDTDGAGMGVNGGYNILLAYNTLYKVGKNSHAIEIVFGGRGCGGEADHLIAAQANHDAGGWGRAVAEESQYYIPNKNIFIYNNIIYNPAPYQSAWTHFSTRADTTPPDNTNAPNPCKGDDNLQILGNFIWNGPADLALGIGESGEARLDPATVRAQNSINIAEPQLTNPNSGNFRPVQGGNVYSVTTYSIPDFSWADAPSPPTVPPGKLSNSVPKNRAGENRTQPGNPGAY
jgi:hypothetical protein